VAAEIEGLAHRLHAPDGNRFAAVAQHDGAVGAFLDFLRVQPAAVRRTVGFVVHHALGEQARERLIDRDMAGGLHSPGEEAGIQ